MSALQFFKQFLRHPVAIGAVSETSRAVSEVVSSEARVEEASVVVEYGSGTGAVTAVILERLPAAGRLLGIELNPKFVQVLRDRFPGMTVVQGSAEDIRKHLTDMGEDGCDSIICGLPLAAFPDALQDRILGESYNVLREGGRFVAFSYLYAPYLPQGRKLRRKLEDTFSRVERTPLIWRNLPPAFAYSAQK